VQFASKTPGEVAHALLRNVWPLLPAEDHMGPSSIPRFRSKTRGWRVSGWRAARISAKSC
jgi:hypothetical protein